MSTRSRRSRSRSSRLRAAALLVCSLAALPAAGHESRYDKLWSLAELYTGRSGSTVESVRLAGRLQIDQASVHHDDEEFSDFSLRRFRLGTEIFFRNDIVLSVEADFDWDNGHPAYNELTDAYVGWQPSKAVNLRAGKHSAPFTLDGMTSSTRLLTIDRSNLANNIWFTDEYMPGISVAGDIDKWTYHFGVYSSGDRNRGFGDSNGGEFWLGTAGYDFGDRLGTKQALLRLNLVSNEPDPRNGFTQPLEKIASLTFELDTGRWGLGTDVSSARGYLGHSDLSAFMVMPRFDLSDSVQLVARYTRVRSDASNGVRFARYESEIVEGRGDDYRELYVGLNYYLNGHKLKIQSGAQYADMDDRARDGGAYAGWAWTMGFRVSW